MSSYSRYQQTKILLLGVVFFIASLTAVVIKKPGDLLGAEGIALLLISISSVIIVLKHRTIYTLLRTAVSILFEQKEYSRDEILRFYGIKDMEITEDTVYVKTVRGKRRAFAIMRVIPFPYPFQHLSKEKKEKYRQGWLNTLQGIDHKCFFMIQSKPFDVRRYREVVNHTLRAVNDPKAKKRLSELVARVEAKAGQSTEKRFYIIIPASGKRNELERDLRTKVNNLTALIDVNLELEAKRLTQEEIIEELGSHFNPNKARFSFEEICRSTKISNLPNSGNVSLEVPCSNFLSVERLEVENDRLLYEHSSEKTVSMFFRVKRFPSKLSFDWLPRLLDTMNYTYDLMIELTPLKFAETVQTLDSEIRNRSVDLKAITLAGNLPPQSLVEGLEETKRIQRAIILGEEKPYNLSIYGRTYHTTNNSRSDDPRNKLNVLTSAIDGHGFFTEKSGRGYLRRFAKKTFILPNLLKEEERLTLSSYLADIFPFGCNTFFSSDISPEGIFIGYTLPSNSPFIIEPQRLLNQIMVILGISGSGKSTLAMTMSSRGNDLGIGFLLLDIQGEYVRHTLDRAGIVLSFGYTTESKGVHTSINLLGLFGFPLPERKRQVLSLFRVVFPDLSFQAVSFLRQTIDQTYREKGLVNDDPLSWNLKPPTMTDLVRNIQTSRKKSRSPESSIWEALERRLVEFARGGGYAFFDGETTLKLEDLTKKLVCINLKPLHSKYAKSLVAYTILQLVIGSFGKTKDFRYVLIDEGWFLLENESEENLIIEIAKTGRKFNTGIIFISQNLQDVGGKARTILNNAAVKVLFRIDETEINAIARCFRLNPFLADKATRLRLGEALIKTVNIPTWVQVAVEKEEVESILQPYESPAIETPRHGTPIISKVATPITSEVTTPLRQKIDSETELRGELSPIVMSELSAQDRAKLKSQGISFVTVGRIRGGNTTYAYNTGIVKNPKHEATVAEVCSYLEEEGVSCETWKTREPDIVCEIGSNRVAIEVEMGTHSPKKIREKIDRLGKQFGRLLILVDSHSKVRYRREVVEGEGALLVNRRDLIREINKLQEGCK